MTDILSKVFEIIIETIVIIPFIITSFILLIFAGIFYPIKKINKWLIKQIIRITDTWDYYIENAYMYEENNE